MKRFSKTVAAFIAALLCTTFAITTSAQSKINQDSIAKKMGWFEDAKLGIFIHYGIYSVNDVSESWSFHNKQVTWPAYMSQLSGFTASKYDPTAWANLFKEAGARYTVITTKHHDGVALWDTKEKHYDVIRNTPAKRDLIEPLVLALRKNDIKVGAYFSLIDWSHPDYPGFLKDSSRYKVANDPARWKRFQGFFQNQLTELSTKFNPDLCENSPVKKKIKETHQRLY